MSASRTLSIACDATIRWRDDRGLESSWSKRFGDT